jgi:hypothetical protein
MTGCLWARLRSGPADASVLHQRDHKGRSRQEDSLRGDTEVDTIVSLGEPSLLICPAGRGAPTLEIWPRLNKKLSSKRALEEQAALLTHFAEHLAGADRQRRGGTLREAEEERWRSRLGVREKRPGIQNVKARDEA